MTDREPVNIMGVIAFPNPNKDERVIRFIDSEYHTLFTIKDGESIVITRFDGEKMVFPCKYIDDCHVCIGNSAYHICKFAEMQERNGNTYGPSAPKISDEIGTYDQDADDTLVVADAEKKLSELVEDGDYLDISNKDIASDATVYFNGKGCGKYSAVKDDTNLAGKGDIIDVYENNDNDVETIVIRSYTYAKIDSVDKDLSKTLKNRGASVELSLVDIDGNSLGNGDYYDDYNSDEKVLNGYTSDYKEGTVLAVAVSAKDKDTILDSYVAKTVTGTPSASRKVQTTDYTNFLLGNYQGAGQGVKNGSITVDGTKYNYAAQFTGLTSNDAVDFDKEYSVYLTAEGYVLAVDGDVKASLSDVYYVVGAYKEYKAGKDSTYVQAISLKDGTVQELKVDTDKSCALTTAVSGANSTSFTPINNLYQLDEDSGKWTGKVYTSNSKYNVYNRIYLTDDVTSSSSVVRTANGVFYLDDTTSFIAAEKDSADIDVKTATGVMSMDALNGSSVYVTVIADGKDALYVIYTGTKLNGATSAADIVYLDGNSNTENKDGWEGSLWFMEGLKNQDVTIDQGTAPTQGFYRYTVNADGIYELKSAAGDAIKAGTEVSSSTSGTATGVTFTTARSNAVTAPAQGQDADGHTYYNTVVFVGTSMSGATVVDTRSSSDMKADDYSNEINTTAKLVAALNKGYVKADVYVEDGKVTFIAVTECANA